MNDDENLADLLNRLSDWLLHHCTRGSHSWQDYERAKAYMRCLWFDHTNWDDGLKIISEYLGV